MHHISCTDACIYERNNSHIYTLILSLTILIALSLVVVLLLLDGQLGSSQRAWGALGVRPGTFREPGIVCSRWLVCPAAFSLFFATELLRVSECSQITCTGTHHQAPRGDSQVSQRPQETRQTGPTNSDPDPKTPGRGSPTPCTWVDRPRRQRRGHRQAHQAGRPDRRVCVFRYSAFFKEFHLKRKSPQEHLKQETYRKSCSLRFAEIWRSAAQPASRPTPRKYSGAKQGQCSPGKHCGVSRNRVVACKMRTICSRTPPGAYCLCVFGHFLMSKQLLGPTPDSDRETSLHETVLGARSPRHTRSDNIYIYIYIYI